MLRLLDDIAKRCPSSHMPDTYLVYDTETSGTDRKKDRILQHGICVVKDNKVKATIGQCIRRPGLYISPSAFNAHGITQARLIREGVDAALYVKELVNMFNWWRGLGHMFCGHNVVSFDIPIFEAEAEEHGCSFKFKENEVIDTGMLVKAHALDMAMKPDETLLDFYRRVSAVRAKGVFWSLDRFCYKHFQLEKRSGIAIDEAHDAEVDSVLTHHVFAAFKELHLGKGAYA